MNLEGQGARATCGDADRSGLDDRGYILVALLVGIAIASVWMAAALPAWRQQVMREREAELIFRGEQYARAIWLYQQKNNQQYPQSLDDLVSQHVLRHKWKDPITDEDFLPLPAGFCQNVPGGVPGGGPAGGPGGFPARGGPGSTTAPGRTSGSAPAVGGPAQGGRPGGVAPPAPPVGAPGLGQPGRGTFSPFSPQPQQSGICGVVSKSDKPSIKIYQQQQQYNMWRFTTQIATQKYAYNTQKYGGGTAPPAGMPIIPGGRPQQPQGVPGGFPVGPGGRNPRGGGGPGVGPGGPGGIGPGPQGPGRIGPGGPAPFPTGPGRGRG